MKRLKTWIAILPILLILFFESGCANIIIDPTEDFTLEKEVLIPSKEEQQITVTTIQQNLTKSEPVMEENGITEETRITEDRNVHAGGYYYDRLSLDEQLWYRDIFDILDGMKKDVILSPEGNETVGEQGMDKVFYSVLNDHPELFFVGGYSYTLRTLGSKIVDFSFSGSYNLVPDERQKRQVQIEEAIAECLSHISREASDYAKVKFVYEYLISQTEYNQNAPDNQNIYSVFVGKQSVCQGYAKATQYLLQKLKIPCTLVVGSVIGGGNEGHAWNMVKVDGQYYYVDTTWGDPSYQMIESDEEPVSVIPKITYDYLCITTKELQKTHVIDNMIPLPECNSIAANYYVMEGAYFTSYEDNAVAAFFEKGYEEGKKDVTLRCADRSTYDIFYDQLLTQQKIFQFLNTSGGVVAYAENPDKLSLTFWLVNE